MTGLSGGGAVDPVALEMVVAVVASSPLEVVVLVSSLEVAHGSNFYLGREVPHPPAASGDPHTLPKVRLVSWGVGMWKGTVVRVAEE